MNDEAIERFFEFINERHAIYIRKTQGDPWPWTDDRILQEFKFTNVFRELDLGTIWLRENWREPYADHSDLFFNICLYRQFNWIPTAEFIGYQMRPGSPRVTGYESEWNPYLLEQRLREWRDSVKPRRKLYTGAHLLTGTHGGPDKIWQTIWPVMNNVFTNMQKYHPVSGDTLESAFKRIRLAPGFGPFIAYEVITDVRHTPLLREARDIMTWANPGPGAMRGINRMYGFPIGWHDGKYFHPKQPGIDYIMIMRHLLDISNKYTEAHVGELEMRDIEHSLCEFDKYCRVLNGEGRPRSRYIPPHMRNE
jgi:hypothetical protein